MRDSKRFGQTESAKAPHDNIPRIIHVAQVTGRDKQRLDLVLRPIRDTYFTPFMQYRLLSSLKVRYRPMRADEQATGATYCRLIEIKPDMAGNAATLRMRGAVTVHDYQVRVRLEFCKSLNHDRSLAEIKQPRKVRKGDLVEMVHSLDFLQLRKRQHDRTRIQFFAPEAVSGVDRRNQFRIVGISV